jgi:hypothetical protein
MGMRHRRSSVFALVITLALGVTLLDEIAATAAGPGDRRLARAGVLRLSDFPSGWTAQPNDDNDDEVEEIAASIKSCKGYLATRKAAHDNPRARSKDFVEGDDQISNTVNVFASTAAARAAVAAVDKPSTETCLQRLFEDVIDQSVANDPEARDQIEGVDVEVSRSSVAPVGDDALAFDAAITVHAKGGQTVELVSSAEFVRVGRVIDSFTVQATSDLPPDLVPSLIDASVGRLEAAGA